jgi:P27 family predicted phage terminase small subunit
MNPRKNRRGISRPAAAPSFRSAAARRRLKSSSSSALFWGALCEISIAGKLKGKMGRPPKPTALKQNEGNPGKRRLGTVDLRSNPAAPKMPAWLDADGRKIWRREMPELLRLGVTRKVDAIAFASLCDSVAKLEQANRGLARRRAQLAELDPATGRRRGDPDEALVVTYPSGAIAQHPLLGIINTEKNNIKRFAVEFGYSPASRARLMVEAGGDIEASYEAKLAEARPDDYGEDDELTIIQ